MMHLRSASGADKRRVFEWRNHEATRAFSFNQQVISWDEHAPWFDALLANPNRYLLLGYESDNDEKNSSADTAIGVVRYDLELRDDERWRARVSVFVRPGTAGRGIGRQLLQAGSEWLRQQRPEVVSIVAEIQDANVASLKAFQHAGYQENTEQSSLERSADGARRRVFEYLLQKNG